MVEMKSKVTICFWPCSLPPGDDRDVIVYGIIEGFFVATIGHYHNGWVLEGEHYWEPLYWAEIPALPNPDNQ